MNKRNYNAEAEKIINSFALNEKKPRLLLHACCAPCASACIERVKDAFDLTVYFYNPNMDCVLEYEKRAEELERLCRIMGVRCVIETYESTVFLDEAKGLETCVEGGARCEKCFRLRLNKAAEYAEENGFDFFTTTLTISPLKNAELLNKTGEAVAKGKAVRFLPTDFKKKGGYQRSIELSAEYGLYRQNYCGCKFSKRNGDKNE